MEENDSSYYKLIARILLVFLETFAQTLAMRLANSLAALFDNFNLEKNFLKRFMQTRNITWTQAEEAEAKSDEELDKEISQAEAAEKKATEIIAQELEKISIEKNKAKKQEEILTAFEKEKAKLKQETEERKQEEHSRDYYDKIILRLMDLSREQRKILDNTLRATDKQYRDSQIYLLFCNMTLMQNEINALKKPIPQQQIEKNSENAEQQEKITNA